MIAISSSWNLKPNTDVQAWFGQIKRIGFQAIEISYTTSHEQLAVIEKCLKEHNIQVTSIHSFCPTPNDEPSDRHLSNYYRLSALDDHERSQAVKWTNICIDTAERVGAQVVVIHAGTLELDDDPSKKVFDLYKEGKTDSDEFSQAREEMLRVREEKKGPHINALDQSLKEVMDHAQKKGIKVGLETRYYPIEIPNFEEIDYFLNQFYDQGMYYWHDVGHAEISERLGIRAHADFINTYKDRMVGAHIHGMQGTRDHLAPFDGDMDLTKILPLLGNDILKVIEARFAKESQIKEAFDKLS